MADLLFRLPPAGSPNLLFGEVESLPDVSATIAGTLPGLQGPVLAGVLFPASVAGNLGGITGLVTARYVSGTDRPVVSRVVAQHQEAAALEVGSAAEFTRAKFTEAGPGSGWGTAAPKFSSAAGRVRDASRASRRAWAAQHQDAVSLAAARALVRHQDASRANRRALTARHQEAAPMEASRSTDWQDRYRDRRPGPRVPWGRATALGRRQGEAYGAALPLDRTYGARYQEAVPPPAGTSVLFPPDPPFDPCYLPDPHLLFQYPFSGLPALLFRCDRHADPEPPPPGATVVVPVRTVYIMNNSVTLIRVSGSVALPVIDFGLQIDADSWTWSFSATLPYAALDDVMPSGPDPVEVEATINSVPYRLIIERVSVDRQFGKRSLRVAGRGRNAVLADPYAERRSFSASGTLTAEQLMIDALTDNGVPIGWSVEFGLTDWSVPGGTWAHQGTWMSAVRAIAEAAGGYVQPHRTAQVLRVLPRYPHAPWDWAGLSPDFELPSAVTSMEAIEWSDKPIYNRVFVSGERNGRLVQVTRTGTAGDVVAPTVVDPLITTADAGRQRGLSVLADVGRQAAVSLKLPVLSETGVILPGALVRYLDGPTTRLGLVRTTAVSGTVQLRQTLGLETHVAP